MGKKLDFQDKVAVVTGAGGGLGRSHALLLASRGAKVVVNDLGGTFTGEGASSKAADTVVDEIKAAGGTAVANYDSVEDGDKIIKTATDSFGRVDIVINNAGILRDVSFHKMSKEDWDLVYQVHVLGAFRVSHAAWPIMREQGYGRIIMTASAAGIYGNFGQANYAMAKLGLAGFANTLAIEGQRKNIHVNTIAPLAGSRMTETILPQNLIDALRPEYVSPLVAWLCHEDCEETGGLFEVGGGFFAKLRWERAAGKCFRLGRDITPELVASSWNQVAGFEETTHPAHVAASMQPIMENINKGTSKGGNQYIDVDEALGYEFPEKKTSYDARDVSLYALSVGAASNPTDDKELQYVYEMHGKGMRTLPTFGVIPGLNALIEFYKEGHVGPGLNYGFDRILHGEQFTEIYAPLPAQATLTHKAKITEIFDKGKHALVVSEINSYDGHGNHLVKNVLTSLVRGAGGWGGDRGPSGDVNEAPDRKPDAVVEETIPENQALLYRLTGDINPLHADPGFAKAFGFDKPILHGLCTFGFSGRHVVSKFAKDGDARYFKNIQARFADSVFPGETLITEMWKESDTKVVFTTKVKGRDSVVISNAAIEFYEEIPKLAPPKKALAETPAADTSAAEPEPTSWDVFVAITDYIERNPEMASKVGYVFQFKISDPSSVWTLDLKNGSGKVIEGAADGVDCTLEINEADFIDMTTGASDPMKLFSTGKLKISGNVMASQKLEFLQKIDPEQAKEAVIKARAAGKGPGASTASTADAGGRNAVAAKVFEALAARLKEQPALIGEVGVAVGFKITEPDAGYIVDLSGKEAKVEASQNPESCATLLSISDADLETLAAGQVELRELFLRGQIRVDGDLTPAHRLGILKGLL